MLEDVKRVSNKCNVSPDRKLFFSIVSLLLALDSRNECSIPYQKLNMLSYESFLQPEYRPIVEKLKG